MEEGQQKHVEEEAVWNGLRKDFQKKKTTIVKAIKKGRKEMGRKKEKKRKNN